MYVYQRGKDKRHTAEEKGGHMMIRFGTGGWRAIIGDEFTKANIQILAKAMAKKMKKENQTEKGIVMG